MRKKEDIITELRLLENPNDNLIIGSRIRRNIASGAIHEIEDLRARLRWLIDKYPGWDNNGAFTFPDGITVRPDV